MQASVEEALSKVANEPITVTVAGRTDAGVHALAQVIHFDTTAARNGHSWVRGAVSNLPDDVALLWASVSGRWFPRALLRHRAALSLRDSQSPDTPDLSARAGELGIPATRCGAMQQGAKHLVGTHDFSSFRAAECQAKNPVRELRGLEVMRHGEFVRIRVYANAFLQHMVRNIAGVLMDTVPASANPVGRKRYLKRATARRVA